MLIFYFRLNRALGKVLESQRTISQYKSERQELIPKLNEAKRSEHTWKTTIEDQRQEYSEARERCTLEEEVIKKLDHKVDSLKDITQASYDQVNCIEDKFWLNMDYTF